MNTQKHLLLVITLFFMLPAFAQTPLRLDDDNPSNAIQDADGNFVAGATSLATGVCNVPVFAKIARKNLGQFSCNSLPDFFQISHDQANGGNTSENTDFIVKANGNIGIGVAEPEAALHVQGKLWPADQFDLTGAPIQLFQDPEGEMIGGFFNVGTAGNAKGGAFVISAIAGTPKPAFVVLNGTDQIVPFGVVSDGTVVTGYNQNNLFNPQGQFNIYKNGVYDYILKIQSSDQNTNYFDVDNDGHVGIGKYWQGNSLLSLYNPNGNTNIDLVSTGNNTEAIRFMAGNNFLHARHQITEENGDFVLDPGLPQGGGNDKLKIDGDVYATKKLGVGIDLPSAGLTTLGVKGAGFTVFDLNESTNGYPAIMRFVNSSGVAKHIITEVNNDLVINPGVGGGGNDKLIVDGDEDVTGTLTTNNLLITNNLTVGRDLTVTRNTYLHGGVDVTGYQFLTSSDTYVHTLGDATLEGSKVEIGTNTWFHARGDANFSGAKLEVDQDTWFHAKGESSFDSKVKIGNVTTPGDYMLYVEKGVLAERFKCALKSDNTNWSDYVFDKSYKLMSIADLEKYVNKNHHLPNIPSAKEVYRDGIDLGDMNAKLLEKIEELSLYIISLGKRVNSIAK